VYVTSSAAALAVLVVHSSQLEEATLRCYAIRKQIKCTLFLTGLELSRGHNRIFESLSHPFPILVLNISKTKWNLSSDEKKHSRKKRGGNRK
jgi:hypothetical protein